LPAEVLTPRVAADQVIAKSDQTCRIRASRQRPGLGLDNPGPSRPALRDGSGRRTPEQTLVMAQSTHKPGRNLAGSTLFRP
jgi:hypothetical protein